MYIPHAIATPVTVTRFFISILAAVFLYGCQSSSADESNNGKQTPDFPSKGFTQMVEYPVEGVRLGQGWHDDQGEKAQAVCIEFQTEMDQGQEQSMNMEVVTDRSEMMQSMNVSAEMQVKAIAYEVSGKASYAKNVEMKSKSMHFVAHAKVNNGVYFTAPLSGAPKKMIALTPTYRSLASKNYPEFERECGEAFVSAIYSGAELNAVLSFEEQSTTKRETIEASMKGSGWGFEAEGSASSTMQDYSSESALRISYFQTGGKGNPIPTDQQGFEEAINRLPQLAAESPFNYRIMVRSYKSLPDFPGKSQKPESMFRDQLATSYGRLLTIHDEITDILQDLDEDSTAWIFGPDMDRAQLETMQDDIKMKLRQQRALARRCAFIDDEEISEEEPCTLPEDLGALYDYDYQILMPLPKAMTNSTGLKYLEEINPDIIDYRVKRNSETRCEDDLDDPGCLTNRQIDGLLEELNAKVTE